MDQKTFLIVDPSALIELAKPNSFLHPSLLSGGSSVLTLTSSVVESVIRNLHEQNAPEVAQRVSDFCSMFELLPEKGIPVFFDDEMVSRNPLPEPLSKLPAHERAVLPDEVVSYFSYSSVDRNVAMLTCQPQRYSNYPTMKVIPFGRQAMQDEPSMDLKSFLSQLLNGLNQGNR